MRTTIYFTECEHQGDLDNYLHDLRLCGATILSSSINSEAETARVEIEYPDSFIESFKKSESFGFSNLVD